VIGGQKIEIGWEKTENGRENRKQRLVGKTDDGGDTDFRFLISLLFSNFHQLFSDFNKTSSATEQRMTSTAYC